MYRLALCLAVVPGVIGSVRVPKEAALGKAKVVLSYDAWKEGKVAPQATELEVVEPTGLQQPSVPEKSAPEKRVDKVVLQYRVARDAVAPSRFVAVTPKGMSPPLEITWDLPPLKDKERQETQDKAKKDFDALIESLEKKNINGVEFECEGELEKSTNKLRVTTVPQLTDAGKKRIQEK